MDVSILSFSGLSIKLERESIKTKKKERKRIWFFFRNEKKRRPLLIHSMPIDFLAAGSRNGGRGNDARYGQANDRYDGDNDRYDGDSDENGGDFGRNGGDIDGNGGDSDEKGGGRVFSRKLFHSWW